MNDLERSTGTKAERIIPNPPAKGRVHQLKERIVRGKLFAAPQRLRCMAEAEGYVMVRVYRCAPFVMAAKEWDTLEDWTKPA